MNQAERYAAQMEKMLANAKSWREKHPNANVLIQFNYPPNIAVISPISSAIKKKIVVANQDGLALLKALWSWDDRYEPTVLMVRAVIEYEENPTNVPRYNVVDPPP